MKPETVCIVDYRDTHLIAFLTIPMFPIDMPVQVSHTTTKVLVAKTTIRMIHTLLVVVYQLPLLVEPLVALVAAPSVDSMHGATVGFDPVFGCEVLYIRRTQR